jgi:hypothetical protein
MTCRVMNRFFLRFLREKEKTRVFDKDSRAEARRKSFPEKGNMLRKVLKMQKNGAKGLQNATYLLEILA